MSQTVQPNSEDQDQTTETPDIGLEPKDIYDLKPEEIVDRILANAKLKNATDLFVLAKENHHDISIRRMGTMEHLLAIPAEMGSVIVNFIRARCEMDLVKRHAPVDGRWIYDSEFASFDLRVNSIGTLWGDDLAIRLLPKQNNIVKIEDLGLVADQPNKMMSMISSKGGLILVTGPTGSGKTTTLYAILDHLNDGTRKINTIEDPIEYAIDGLCQCQVQERTGMSFSTLLRGMIRQSPDVIMIGEIRDEETAQIAVRAANSGHLVLTTVHSPSAVGAVQSLIALGVNPVFLANSLLGVMSQRLIRILSPESKVRYDTNESSLAFEPVKNYLRGDEGTAIYGPNEEDEKSQGGYSHQSGLFELIEVTPRFRQALYNISDSGELNRLAAEEGMLTFQNAGLIKVAKGETSLEEVMRVLPQLD